MNWQELFSKVSHGTIRLGSRGSDVEAWQRILGVEADGVFGPKTEKATVEYQSAHGLTADGVVGPMTWASAGIKTPTKTNTSSPATSADKEAYEIAKRASEGKYTEAEIQYVLAVARGEGFYGRGWANPSDFVKKKSAEFGLTGYEGIGSNNWGAVQGVGSAGSFKHIDRHADGTWYVGTFRKYTTPEEAYLGMAKNILGGGPIRKEVGAAEIKKAINKGSLHDAVFVQHANKYFELNPNEYLKNVLSNYSKLTNNIGWKPLLSEKGKSIAGKIMLALGVTAAAIGAKKIYDKVKS